MSSPEMHSNKGFLFLWSRYILVELTDLPIRITTSNNVIGSLFAK